MGADPEQKGGDVSYREEPVLAGGTDGALEEKGTTVPDRCIGARANVSTKPLGLWGIRAWVWELRVPVDQRTDGVPGHDLTVDVRDGGMENSNSSDQTTGPLEARVGYASRDLPGVPTGVKLAN